MRKGDTNSNRLAVFGDSMMGKLPAVSRKRRKRHASKRRRTLLENIERVES